MRDRANENDTRFSICLWPPEGTRVVSIMGEMGRAFDGGYAEYVLLPNEQIYPVSTALSWEKLVRFRKLTSGWSRAAAMENVWL